MKTQLSTLRSELESIRRPAVELRRFANEIRQGLQSALQSRAEQTKKDMSLRKAYRQCKQTLRNVLRPGCTLVLELCHSNHNQYHSLENYKQTQVRDRAGSRRIQQNR